MAFQRGDMLLVPFPYSDLSTTKVRPAVVISSLLYHTLEPDLILAAITSKLTGAVGPLDYILLDWQQAGLRQPSALKPVLLRLIRDAFFIRLALFRRVTWRQWSRNYALRLICQWRQP